MDLSESCTVKPLDSSGDLILKKDFGPESLGDPRNPEESV